MEGAAVADSAPQGREGPDAGVDVAKEAKEVNEETEEKFPLIKNLLDMQGGGKSLQLFRITDSFLTGAKNDKAKYYPNTMFVYNHPYEEDQFKKFDKAKQKTQTYARQYATEDKNVRGANRRAAYAWNRVLPKWTLEATGRGANPNGKKQLMVTVNGNETPCLAHGQLGWINRLAKAHCKYVPSEIPIEDEVNAAKKEPKLNTKIDEIKALAADPMKVKFNKSEKDIKVSQFEIQDKSIPNPPCIKATVECLSTVCALGLGLPTYAVHIGVKKTTNSRSSGVGPYTIEFSYIPGSGAFLQTHAENFSQRSTSDSYRTAVLESLVSLSISDMFINNNTGKRMARVFNPQKPEKTEETDEGISMSVMSPSIVIDCPVPAKYEKHATVVKEGVDETVTTTVPVGIFSICESHNFIIDDAVPGEDSAVSSQAASNISTSSQWLTQLRQGRESTVFIDAVKQNAYMVNRFALQCIFMGISECRIAIVVPDTRSVGTGKGHANYSVAYVRTMPIEDLKKMLNLSETQVYGIIETLYSLFSNMPDGDYILTKEAYDPSYYIFSREAIDFKRGE